MIVFKNDSSDWDEKKWEEYEESIKWVYEDDAEEKIEKIGKIILMREFNFGSEEEK
jgi:hypothetical protein